MPDGVVVVDHQGTIVAVNQHARELFGYDEGQLVGRKVELLLPEDLRDRHVGHRTSFTEHPTTRPMAEGQDLAALHRDGHAIPVDIALAPMTAAGTPVVAAFVRDATARVEAEAARQRAHDAERARQHALELNDNVLQGLTTAMWQLDLDDVDGATRTLSNTSENARQMVSDLLNHGAPAVSPGDLVRARSAPDTGIVTPPARSRPDLARLRVLLADDAADLRLLLRIRLEKLDDVEVVGEATDGEEALELAEELRPDVVVMDLSMPRVDGLQATERLRDRYPSLRIVVLSGYPSSAMRAMALAAGADEYIQKGPDLGEIESAVRIPAAT